MSKKPPLAIVYDFDGTLAPGNMQERNFIPAIGMNTKKFWDQVKEESQKHQADNILMYMKLMLDKAQAASVQVYKSNFKSYGNKLLFFEGVQKYIIDGIHKKGWFDRINEYGKESGVKVEHYIVSSGIKGMIEGTPIAKKFRAIYASSFWYDHHNIAVWPALAINFTTKTQYLFRINKGSLDVSDNDKINEYIREKDRPVPFRNMIYIGDGYSDIPCFRLVKDRGGHSIAVYKPNTKGAKDTPKKLISDGRVNFMAPADYKENSTIDRIIKALIDKVAHDDYVYKIQ